MKKKFATERCKSVQDGRKGRGFEPRRRCNSGLLSVVDITFLSYSFASETLFFRKTTSKYGLNVLASEIKNARFDRAWESTFFPWYPLLQSGTARKLIS